MVGDHAKPLPERPHVADTRLKRPDHRHRGDLAGDRQSWVVTAADHERIEPVLLGREDGLKHFGLDEVLREVVVDVAGAVVEVDALHRRALAQVWTQRVQHELVELVCSEWVKEADAGHGELVS